MHRIDGPGATVDNKFTEGDPAGGVQATVVTDDWLNDVQENVMGVLTAASIAPIKGDYTQLATAIMSIIAGATDGIAGAASNLRGSATGTTAPVLVTADSVCVKNATGQQRTLNAVSIAPSLTTVGVNGLDTGTVGGTVSTWYYVWVIWNGTTTAGLISLSSTAPTMPAGYTYKARVSEFRTDATANKYPLKFLQAGKNFTWVLGGNVANIPQLITGVSGSIAGSPAGWTAVAVGAAVPPTAYAIHVLLGSTSGSTGTAIVAPSALYGGVAGNPTPPLCLSAGSAVPTCVLGRMMLEGTNVYYACNAAAFVLNCTGWESNL
jgi:hypothetical protein